MTHRERIILEIAVVLVIGAALFFALAVARSNDRIAAAERTAATEQELRKQAQAQAQKIQEDATQQINTLRLEFSKIKTPQQAAQAIPQYFHDVQPQVITIPVPSPQVPGTVPEKDKTPTQQQLYTLTPEELMSLAKQGEECKECGVQLQSEKSVNDTLRTELKSCDKERLQWKDTAKGGSFWQRFKSNMKVAGVALVVGVAAGAIITKIVLPWRSHALHRGVRNRVDNRARGGPGDLYRPGQDQVETHERD